MSLQGSVATSPYRTQMPPAWLREALAAPDDPRRHRRAGGTVLAYRGLPVAVLWYLGGREADS